MQCKWTFTKRFYPFNTTKKRPQESTCPIRILFDLVLRCSCIQCIGLPDDRYFTDLAGILLINLAEASILIISAPSRILENKEFAVTLTRTTAEFLKL